jgi:hypothetical protein
VAERALQAGMRPLLSGSRLVDPDIKIGWSDDQRAVTQFVAAPTHDDGTQWLCSVGRHIDLDRPNPR